LRLSRMGQAQDFINAVGLCFLFPDRRVELPSLWEAICGERRPLPARHDDAALGLAWNWKDELPTRGLVYYGKLLARKPTFVSLPLLPCLYALSENLGELDDYLAEYSDGRLSLDAKRVLEALIEHGPLPTSHLRRRAHLAGKANASRFDRAIAELQQGLKIVKTGISDANAWRYCYIYDLVLRRFPDLAEHAADIPRSTARVTLLRQYLWIVGASSAAEIQRLFGWSGQDVARACDTLKGKGELLDLEPTDDSDSKLVGCAALLNAAR